MQSLLTYSISLFGFCFIVGSSAISLPLREWAFDLHLDTQTYQFCTCKNPYPQNVYVLRWPLKLIECAACLSFWCGLFCSMCFHVHVVAIVGTTFAGALPFALFSCGSSAILGLLTGLMK